MDPSDGDSLSLVGEESDGGYCNAVLGNDAYICGISLREVIKFSQIYHSVSYMRSEFVEDHFWTDVVLANDGNIYAASKHGQILRIDTAQNDWKIIESRMYNEEDEIGWEYPVLSVNKCIYFPPARHGRVLKYNASK